MQNMLWFQQTSHFCLWLFRDHCLCPWRLYSGLDNQKNWSFWTCIDSRMWNMPPEVLRKDESRQKENMLQNITIKNKKFGKTWTHHFSCHVCTLFGFSGCDRTLYSSAFCWYPQNIFSLWFFFTTFFQNCRSLFHFKISEGSFQTQKKISRWLNHSNCLSYFDAQNCPQKMIVCSFLYMVQKWIFHFSFFCQFRGS